METRNSKVEGNKRSYPAGGTLLPTSSPPRGRRSKAARVSARKAAVGLPSTAPPSPRAWSRQAWCRRRQLRAADPVSYAPDPSTPRPTLRDAVAAAAPPCCSTWASVSTTRLRWAWRQRRRPRAADPAPPGPDLRGPRSLAGERLPLHADWLGLVQPLAVAVAHGGDEGALCEPACSRVVALGPDRRRRPRPDPVATLVRLVQFLQQQ